MISWWSEARGGPFRYGFSIRDEWRDGKTIAISFMWRACEYVLWIGPRP